MAPRTDKNARLRGRGCVAHYFPTDHETGSDKASGAVGAIVAASLLRTSTILLCRSHSDGQCFDAEWMATIRAFDRDICGHVDYGEALLKERGQDRSRKTTNLFQVKSGSSNESGCVRENPRTDVVAVSGKKGSLQRN